MEKRTASGVYSDNECTGPFSSKCKKRAIGVDAVSLDAINLPHETNGTTVTNAEIDTVCEWRDLPIEIVRWILFFCDGPRLDALSLVNIECYRLIRNDADIWANYLKCHLPKAMHALVWSPDNEKGLNVTQLFDAARQFRRLPIGVGKSMMVKCSKKSSYLGRDTFLVREDLMLFANSEPSFGIWSTNPQRWGRSSSAAILESGAMNVEPLWMSPGSRTLHGVQLSPDGRYVVGLTHLSALPSAQIEIVSLSPGSAPKMLPPVSSSWLQYRWAPDSQHLILMDGGLSFAVVRLPCVANELPNVLWRLRTSSLRPADWCVQYNTGSTGQALVAMSRYRTIDLHDYATGQFVSQIVTALDMPAMRFVNIGNASVLTAYTMSGTAWIDPRMRSPVALHYLSDMHRGAISYWAKPQMSPAGCIVHACYSMGRGRYFMIQDRRKASYTGKPLYVQYELDIPDDCSVRHFTFDEASPHSLYLNTRDGGVVSCDYLS